MTYIWGRRGRSLLEDHTQDGQQEGSSLARASLCTSHEVTIPHDDGKSILLHWGRLGVFCQLHVTGWREGWREGGREGEREGGRERGRGRKGKNGRRGREGESDEGVQNLWV